MGTLLLVALPFLLTFSFGLNESDRRQATFRKIIGFAGLGAILLAVAVNGSLAAVALAVPLVAASTLLIPRLRRFRAAAAMGSILALLGALIFLANSPVQAKLTGESTLSFEARSIFWKRSGQLIQNSFPVGTGLGTFQTVYAADAGDEVSHQIVNHAHNDYIEILLETGLGGAALALAFLAWWSKQAVNAFSGAGRHKYAGAAAIASAAILAHSAVDYPLRTATISTTFAFCLAIMALGRASDKTGEGGGGHGRARHLKIG